MKRMALVLGFCLAGAVSVLRADAAGDKDKPSWLPSTDRALIVASAGDSVTLSWKSQTGRLYTIMYTDKPQGEARWLPLPGYERMPGTGRTETLKFKVDPAAPRRFNLHVEDASAAKKKPAK